MMATDTGGGCRTGDRRGGDVVVGLRRHDWIDFFYVFSRRTRGKVDSVGSLWDSKKRKRFTPLPFAT